VHLRMDEQTNKYYTQTYDETNIDEHTLPFTLRLNDFKITYHSGTTAAADYETSFTLYDNGKETEGLVSMNNIYSHRGYRFYQSSYDNDGKGSILSLNHDPWGIPITYTGYALLFLSLVWMLIAPNGSYRKLLRNPLLKKGVLSLMLLTSVVGKAQAVTALPKETADKFGQLNILYNDRICPLQTFAIDFTKKLCGKATYNGMTAEQVLTGFIFYGDEWGAEPIIKIGNGAMKETLQLPSKVSVNTFFSQAMGGYTIGPYVREYYQGNHDKFHKQVADTDDKLQLIMELRRGTLLKIFPCTDKGTTTWYAPTDKLPAGIGKEQALYIRNIFSLLYGDVLAGNTDRVNEMIDKMIAYQEKFGGSSLPTTLQTKAERAYNAVPFATILFIFNLTIGVLSLLLLLWKGWGIDWIERLLMLLSFAALTVCEALRWIVSGTIPMSNGYETMLFVAWLVMLVSLLACRRFHIVLAFGFLVSGFFLLVSHIGQMSPNIGRVMPVLNSPLLSVHVSVIMTAFALLSLTFICGLTALMLRMFGRSEALSSLQLLSQLFLFPALTFLGIGIFVGAIWANVSWGNYWGWDPKEVWALITFMVYAVAVHTTSIPALHKPTTYHVFMTLAFLTIIMTYFGVNYFLGGMHSYA